ncbi:MAG: betB [Alphaproteobacteria bacterium]|jgi:acyl-CoA reductase-like NAD-dependent aldehyde dehydrogenase|nr:betB [Alphaproteobacteria bacterium]
MDGLLIGDKVTGGSGAVLRSINPADGLTNYEIAGANAADIDRAATLAQQAVRDAGWRKQKPHERARLLSRIADAIAANGEALARQQMIENGKVLAECRAQAASAAATFRYYAAACETMEAETPPARGNYFGQTVYEPYGVIVAITPWNSPLTMEAQKIAPALAAGNAVLLKPSEITSGVGLIVARLALEAGLPPGLLQVLPGNGRETGTALVNHDAVRMISFTGGTGTGRAIAAVAALRLIPAALELGGKSPNIVFADADLDAAIEGVIGGIFEATGQSCVAGSRLFVQRAIYSSFVERIAAAARGLRPGLPESSGAQIGPLASFAQRERVESFVASAREEGGQVLAGGQRPADQALQAGAFYLPTVIDGLSGAATVCREEIFGPVLAVLPFDGEDDLIAQVNESVYGLACGLWTADYKRAWRVARAIEAGTVWINTYKQLSIAAPFGGFKQSGIGREKGLSGLRLYQQAKSLYWGLDG